jgi:hypothetical protein
VADAALLSGAVEGRKRTVAPLSGGNVTEEMIRHMLGLAAD